jgi:hypothetical protein
MTVTMCFPYRFHLTILWLWISALSLAITSSLPAHNETSLIFSFPLQFSARITITSHLIEANNGDVDAYPPKTRSMVVYYDYPNRLARADLEAGYEAAKVYIRRYDDAKAEYMIRLPPINDCKRAYLGEAMPYPVIHDLVHIGQQAVGGISCEYYLHEDYETRIHIYMSSYDGSPVRLVQESIDDSGRSFPLLTYDYSEVMLGPPDASWFELPEPYSKQPSSSCARHAAGFPYLHIFHYFVKF